MGACMCMTKFSPLPSLSLYTISRLVMVPMTRLTDVLVVISLTLGITRAAVAPNTFLGSCLTEEWAKSVESNLKLNRTERDAQGRLLHPFLRGALTHQLRAIDDPRTARATVYSPNCLEKDAVFYGFGSVVDKATGEVLSAGIANQSLIVELSGWTSHSLTTLVFSILATEMYGYKVSHYYVTDTLALTERMSSVRSGVCTPTHVNMEVWIAGIEASLRVYSNESFAAGGVGYFRRSGLYTTTDFVNDSMNTTKHPSPLFADFWKGYKFYEDLIRAVPVSSLRNNSNFFPPAEVGCADDSGFGCQGNCSRTQACTDREAKGGECMVVAMMYDYFDPGYLQAVMANIGIPTYFCFIGYDAVQNFAIDSQKQNRPVLFYHYEPDLFHINHAGLFSASFYLDLCRSV